MTTAREAIARALQTADINWTYEGQANDMIAALDQAGFVILPKEATEAMVIAAEVADEAASERNLDEGGPGKGAYFDEIYRAMLTAAHEDGK